MSNFLSVKFLIFVICMFLGFEISDIITYFFLKHIKKDKNIKGVKFKFLANWWDEYFSNKYNR